jgi:hypothetical protein
MDHYRNRIARLIAFDLNKHVNRRGKGKTTSKEQEQYSNPLLLAP